jgi:hypothetical protein
MYLGYTTESSLKNALNIVGENDAVYYENDQVSAYPVAFGNGSHTLVTNTIANASFEYSGIVDQYASQYAQHIYGWTSAGSSNTFNSLSSEIMPTNGNQMAMLSTGIGSSESIYFASKEGSSLSQVFSVSPDVSVLRFDYNLVSEEPMEFVGSKYDDCFEVRLVDKDTGVTHLILSSSINTATWTPISAINFAGGDDTAYQTGWLTCDYDISGFKGKEVELVFIVYDKGDSLFDTAVMIDNIRLS